MGSEDERLKEKEREARGSSARAKGVEEREGEVSLRSEGIKFFEVAVKTLSVVLCP